MRSEKETIVRQRLGEAGKEIETEICNERD